MPAGFLSLVVRAEVVYADHVLVVISA